MTPDRPPRITVVMPVFNEVSTIGEILGRGSSGRRRKGNRDRRSTGPTPTDSRILDEYRPVHASTLRPGIGLSRRWRRLAR